MHRHRWQGADTAGKTSPIIGPLHLSIDRINQLHYVRCSQQLLISITKEPVALPQTRRFSCEATNVTHTKTDVYMMQPEYLCNVELKENQKEYQHSAPFLLCLADLQNFFLLVPTFSFAKSFPLRPTRASGNSGWTSQSTTPTVFNTISDSRPRIASPAMKPRLYKDAFTNDS